ncbi:MAG: PIN domain-containing protein [Spirochaetales bacterium]|nr:PIN domain-containing protein [Spirochaetales bacterium]
MNDKYFFDTNILVYANDSSEKEKQKIARALVKDSLHKQNGVISVQVLSEFWVTVTRKIKNPLPIAIAEKETELFQLMEIVNLDYLLFKEALRFQRLTHVSYWDSLILAASYSSGCKKIYTEDLNHGQTISNMELCNPFL